MRRSREPDAVPGPGRRIRWIACFQPGPIRSCTPSLELQHASIGEPNVLPEQAAGSPFKDPAQLLTGARRPWSTYPVPTILLRMTRKVPPVSRVVAANEVDAPVLIVLGGNGHTPRNVFTR